jgi:enoyl-CoA hydratase
MNIEFARSGPVATIRLNRPEKRNALTSEMLGSLSQLLDKIENSTDVRALILTAEGNDAFCAGTDIRELAELDQPTALRASRHGQAVCDQLEKLPLPVIAAINGIAAGGGFELALACHLRVAVNTAQFSLPEIKLGTIPAYGGTQRLLREIGRGRAIEMILTGENISAEQAKSTGLVNRVVDRENLIPHVELLAHQIASMATLAIRAGLKAVIEGSEKSLDDGLDLEARLFASLFSSEDVHEGTRAFLEKRQPQFKGA